MLKQNLTFKLSQKLSPQQIKLMKLIQLPTLDFEQRIKNEIEENPALETGTEEKATDIERLEDANFSENNFDNQEIVWGGDFETKWRVEDLMVSLKVIFAGGHNIQRFHPRILVNVK